MLEKYSLPIKFEQLGNVLDDRFIKVKIWIAHTGENRNNSIFSKEVLEGMIPSLSNAIILGYIGKNESGEADFEGHETRLVVENGEVDIKYVGRAWGVIPESNNAHFEFRYGEDGVEREYLVCEGVLWRKFPEVEEIFDRDSGYKSQSMELYPPSVQGYFNENGLFVFTQAKVEGACILGEGVTPAMISSTIEKFSVANNIKAEFSELLTEFNTHFSLAQEKGDNKVDNESKVVNADPNGESVSPDEFTESTVENPDLNAQGEESTNPDFSEKDKKKDKEDDENKGSEEDNEKDSDEKDDEKDSEKDSGTESKDDKDKEDEKKKKFTLQFELSHDDIRWSLYQAIENHEQFKDSWVWISQVFDSHAIVENEGDGKYYKVNYVKHENAVSLGEFEEIYPMWVNSSEKQAIELARNSFSKYEALEKEVEDLREFRAKAEYSAKEEKLTSYASLLSDKEYKALQDNLSSFTVTDLEKEIGLVLLRKNHFSASDKQAVEDNSSRISAVPAEPNFQYGTLSKYFTK